MPDLGLSVSVTRPQLGLPDLALNDHFNYFISPTFLGGMVQWNRSTVTSPFLDGGVTTYRTRQMVQEQIALEVMGETLAEMWDNVRAAIDAFTQDQYNLALAIGSEVHQFMCEAADYQFNWNGPRILAQQVQLVLSVPRQPVAVQGGF